MYDEEWIGKRSMQKRIAKHFISKILFVASFLLHKPTKLSPDKYEMNKIGSVAAAVTMWNCTYTTQNMQQNDTNVSFVQIVNPMSQQGTCLHSVSGFSNAS